MLSEAQLVTTSEQEKLELLKQMAPMMDDPDNATVVLLGAVLLELRTLTGELCAHGYALKQIANILNDIKEKPPCSG